MLSEVPTFGINGSFGPPEANFIINFSKSTTKFCLSLHYNTNNSYLFVMEMKSLNLKLTIKILTFQLNLVLDINLMNLVLLSP